MNDRPIMFRASEELFKQLEALARSQERSIAWVARKFVEEGLKSPSSNGFPPQPLYDNNIPPLSLTPTPNNIMVEVMPRKPRQQRGTRLPSDFLPDQGGQELALSLGLDLQATLDHFRDFWTAKPGQGGVKLDWQATWRNWCRNTRGRGGAATRATGLEGFSND